jgi:hypothetical protein
MNGRLKDPIEDPFVDQSEIAKRACEVHLERDGSHGRDVDGWQQAEQGLRDRRSTSEQ